MHKPSSIIIKADGKTLMITTPIFGERTNLVALYRYLVPSSIIIIVYNNYLISLYYLMVIPGILPSTM